MDAAWTLRTPQKNAPKASLIFKNTTPASAFATVPRKPSPLHLLPDAPATSSPPLLLSSSPPLLLSSSPPLLLSSSPPLLLSSSPPLLLSSSPPLLLSSSPPLLLSSSPPLLLSPLSALHSQVPSHFQIERSMIYGLYFALPAQLCELWSRCVNGHMV